MTEGMKVALYQMVPSKLNGRISMENLFKKLGAVLWGVFMALAFLPYILIVFLEELGDEDKP